MNLQDTIAAISTPPGRGGIGIVRLSGPTARDVARQIVRFRAGHEWRPWRAVLAEIPGDDGAAVDQVLVTYFAAPRSYTAEDVVEISCHGSPAVLRYAVERACRVGARPAEPGEFTLRAYVNGRLDLVEAEAVRDLIEATTLYQAKLAARQMGGSLSALIAPQKRQLVDLIALLEAGIDFAEDDVPVASAREILERLDPVREGLRRLAASYAYGRLVHDGLTLAIVGKPNAGKSSLFNRLLEQDRAIVTETPGTTRDLVSEVAAIGGIPVKLVDTAGIRDSGDQIEALGIERSYRAMADADLTLVVIDLSEPDDGAGLIEEARRRGRAMVVGNKCDLPVRARLAGVYLAVSALTGEGIDRLRGCIAAEISQDAASSECIVTSLRHARLLEESAAALDKARAAVTEDIPHEMVLLDLYAALQALDELTGATTAEDILKRIFSTFCIGK